METTFYTLTAREVLVEGAAVQRVSGGGARQLVCVRKASQPAPAGGGKVIDMAAWKADREEQARLEELWYGDVPEELLEDDWDEAEYTVPAPRARRSHRSALNAELWASLAVVGVMVILGVRLLFGF